MLQAKGIRQTYPSADGRLLEVLVDATLTVESGRSAAIIGPSGSGKTTLLAILGTLERPTSGTLRLGGVDPLALSDAELAAFRSRRIGFVFQDHHLLPQCTVLENVLVPLLADGAAKRADVEKAQQLIMQVGLTERESHRPAQLSGGERQRAALARALVRDPDLLLADEPTGNLDRNTAAVVTDLLIALQQAPKRCW